MAAAFCFASLIFPVIQTASPALHSIGTGKGKDVGIELLPVKELTQLPSDVDTMQKQIRLIF